MAKLSLLYETSQAGEEWSVEDDQTENQATTYDHAILKIKKDLTTANTTKSYGDYEIVRRGLHQLIDIYGGGQLARQGTLDYIEQLGRITKILDNIVKETVAKQLAIIPDDKFKQYTRYLNRINDDMRRMELRAAQLRELPEPPKPVVKPTTTSDQAIPNDIKTLAELETKLKNEYNKLEDVEARLLKIIELGQDRLEMIPQNSPSYRQLTDDLAQTDTKYKETQKQLYTINKRMLLVHNKLDELQLAAERDELEI